MDFVVIIFEVGLLDMVLYRFDEMMVIFVGLFCVFLVIRVVRLKKKFFFLVLVRKVLNIMNRKM